MGSGDRARTRGTGTSFKPLTDRIAAPNVHRAKVSAIYDWAAGYAFNYD